MAKRRRPRLAAIPTITAQRLRRLTKLLHLLQRRPMTRSQLLRQLRMDERTFYRDLEILRRLAIVVVQEGRLYRLETDLREAFERLPLPDPKLTLGEAQILAQGRTAAHRKLARFLREVLGPPRR
ncbi:MAG: hypothetical protein RMI91_05595 [Gemmatales bacterium]|nr:hypothetical protein [Gemmatales bacterium]MDW7994108.1 hypothetical protein [Gemmatales bacterium]